MSRKTIIANTNNSLNASFLSSNDKVMQYLQNSGHCSTNTHINNNNNYNDNPLLDHQKTSSHAHDLFYVKDTLKNTNHYPYQHRMHSCSENSSPASNIDTLSRFDITCASSLFNVGRRCSTFSSNTSSSGICSTFSDIEHEESTSTPPDDFDFNLGFEQISDNDEFEIDDLDEIDEYDEYEQNERNNQRISNKNSDKVTLLDSGESNSDVCNNEYEGFLHKSYNSTTPNDNIAFSNDHQIEHKQIKQQKQQLCASLLHDSTHTLNSSVRSSVYTESDDNEKDKVAHAIGTRSNSLGIAVLNKKSALLDKTSKKVVRFADTLGLDLESIRYMTPPDQSANSLIQECIRNKLEQLWVVKGQSNSLSTSPCPFGLSNVFNRSSPSTSFNASKKSTNQYYLVSKYFTSRTKVFPLIYEQQVMLECLYTKDSIAYGTVRVHNCAHDKRVFVRISKNDWKNFQDIYGLHSMNCPNDITDTFIFEIRLDKYDDKTSVPKQIYFAICLQTNNQEFWDNNCGRNYALDVLER
ncbi:unnamed protein product [Rotaria sp. Silwood2]|nr:unnamed protein product [Rotaria sp. Silwood2]CAF3081944.1 unnamed protein product [Rotaria sp. Silwood2]CAF3391010.1 unnamed protein product [Rotaria sp. Silwood2]CAF4336428.1 unnamed protein product [Rotaria sp. Silwood2]CAF4346345.1 unnamed protein product [Rotaria sp. Silwood2]